VKVDVGVGIRVGSSNVGRGKVYRSKKREPVLASIYNL